LELLYVCAATFTASFLSGILPLVSIEAYLLGVAALAPACPPLLVVTVAALGQMSAKLLLYLGGRGVLRFPLPGHDRVAAATARLARHSTSPPLVVFGSALSGLPPFYLVSVAAGILRFRVATFLVVGLAGRFLRFGAVILLPHLIGEAVR
jgi:membrane protein YqaA with SNARE-associated domain